MTGDIAPLPRESVISPRPDMIILHACDPHAVARENINDGLGHLTASLLHHVPKLQSTNFSNLWPWLAQGVKSRFPWQRPWIEMRLPYEVRLSHNHELIEFPRWQTITIADGSSSSLPIETNNRPSLIDTRCEVVGLATRPEQGLRNHCGIFARMRSCLSLVRNFFTMLRARQIIHE